LASREESSDANITIKDVRRFLLRLGFWAKTQRGTVFFPGWLEHEWPPLKDITVYLHTVTKAKLMDKPILINDANKHQLPASILRFMRITGMFGNDTYSGSHCVVLVAKK